MALAIPLLLAVAACSSPGPRPPDPSSWEGQTEIFLWGTIEPTAPYPTIHLPTGVVSVYEQSAAILARQRFDPTPLPPTRAAAFVDDLLRARDGTTGLVTDSGAASGTPATLYGLRALVATDRLDIIDASWQGKLLSTTTASLQDPAHTADVYRLADSYALAAFLAHHGTPAVAAQATRALQVSPSSSGCAFSGTDIFVWGAQAEIAAAVGRSCDPTPVQSALLVDRANQLSLTVQRANEFSIDALAQLQALARVLAAQATPDATLRQTLDTLIAALRKAVPEGRVDPRPVPLAIAAELTSSGESIRLADDAARTLDQVLLWGSQYGAFDPSVPMFLHIARSILILDGSDIARSRLVGWVDWSALEPADRLALATFLDPSRLDSLSITAAIRQRPPAADGNAWPALASDASIARAALIHGESCGAEVNDWVTAGVHRAVAAAGPVPAAGPTELSILLTLLRLARSCLGEDWAEGAELMEMVRAAAPDLLARSVRETSTAAGSRTLLAIQTAMEVTCGLDLATPPVVVDDVRALLDAARAHPIGVGIVDGRRFAADETFAYLRIRQILTTGCSGAP